MNIWQKMNLPNKITMTRFAAAMVFVVVVALGDGWFDDLIAGIIFIAAACTDFIDGHIARSRNLVTTFGKFMDPLVDKVLVTAALISLVDMGRVAAWVVILILMRELAITGLRTIAVSEGVVIAAAPMGKLKTTCQMVAIACLLLYTVPFLPQALLWWAGQILMYLALILTLVSGWDYLVKCRDLLSDM